jgi:hypothetical protein
VRGVDLHDDRKRWRRLVVVMGKMKGRGSAFMTVVSGDVGALVFAVFTPNPSRTFLYLRKGRGGD